MEAIEITMDNFESEVLKSDKPVLVDFWSQHCMPCRMLMPTIEELAGEVTEAKICKVNVEDYPELAARYGVMHIPTLIVVKDGQTVRKEVGVKPKEEILNMLKL